MITWIASIAFVGLGPSCVTDDGYEELGPTELNEADGETSIDVEPLLGDIQADSELNAPAPPAPININLCPGGCNNPPTCHVGPGVCLGGASGNPTCYYHKSYGEFCDGGNPCLIAECIDGGCVNNDFRNAGTPCDDGDPSTVNDACDGWGNCEGEVTCPGGCNNPPTCHVGPGVCLDSAIDGPTCYYHKSQGEICDGGNPCMLAECIDGGCTNTYFLNAGTPCDDGNACTDGDQCNGVGICTGIPIPCGPGPGPGPGPVPAPLE
ncbi:MAG: hypothetical protein AAGF11_54645 [Myxococcota bacterium]